MFGKAGRAETATDPAPIEMFETTIKLKPRDQWRPGMTPEKLKAELDALVKFPGLSNAWGYPIKTRIDMLATGIRTPVGIKIMGPDLAVIQQLGQRIEDILRDVEGTTSVYAERTATGALHRRGHRPRGRGALRAQHQGRAGHRRERGRRHDGELHRRGPRALSDQPALPAGFPRLARGAARAADRRSHRCERHARRRGAGGGGGRAGDDPQRERPAVRLGVRRPAGTRPRRLRRARRSSASRRNSTCRPATASAGPASTSTSSAPPSDSGWSCR